MIYKSTLTLIAMLTCQFVISQNCSAQQIDRKVIEPQGDVIWEMPNKHNKVALTFDDGPDPIYTQEILELLSKYNAKATFFLIGEKVKKFPYIVQQEINAGHEIGNHSFSHPFFNTITKAQVAHEISNADLLIQKFKNRNSQLKLFRPPGGILSESDLKEIKRKEYKTIMWSWHQDPRDWDNRSSNEISSHVLTNIQSGDIILLHDSGGNRSETIKALEQILIKLNDEYKFVTISELLTSDPVFGQ
ncbi:polysaccharide deacetylase family protein [Rossellomorea marisflavi]|uniref:polysaccharide deacetylase family protein n=1 Tax=Rossellomorea marisflavi TaxID=189381 RepID=UPI00345B2D09